MKGMKIKIFTSTVGIGHLEDNINKFIIGKEILDIKMQLSGRFTVVLIMYNGDENDN